VKPIASASDDHFDDEVITLSPECSDSQLVEAARSSFAPSYRPSIKIEYRNSWSDVASKLEAAYQKLH
jgi:hypothetical protein